MGFILRYVSPSSPWEKKNSSDMTKHLVTSQMVYEAHQVLISAKQITAQRTQTRLIGAREV